MSTQVTEHTSRLKALEERLAVCYVTLMFVAAGLIGYGIHELNVHFAPHPSSPSKTIIVQSTPADDPFRGFDPTGPPILDQHLGSH